MSQLGRLGRRVLPSLLRQLERATALGALKQFTTADDASAAPPSSGMGKSERGGDGGEPRPPGSGPPSPKATGGSSPGSRRGGDGAANQAPVWQPRQASQGSHSFRESSGGSGSATSSSTSRVSSSSRGSTAGGDSSSSSSTVRKPGAMSQLLAQRPRRDEGGPRERGDRQEHSGGGKGSPRRPHRRGMQQQHGEGEEGDRGYSDADLYQDLPAELIDTPHDIIMRFEYALRDAANPEADPVPIKELGTDIADLANLDNLALLRFYITPEQWRSFSSGTMDVEEQNELMDKLAAALVADERYWQKKQAVKDKIDADPDYDLAASLGSTPQLRGSRRGPPPPRREQVEAEIEANKEQLMAQHSMSEEEFQATKQATVQHLLRVAHKKAAPVLPNHLTHERRLGALLDKMLPRDHPHYTAAKQKLAVLQSNPGWPHERKIVFAKRLLKRLAAEA